MNLRSVKLTPAGQLKALYISQDIRYIELLNLIILHLDGHYTLENNFSTSGQAS
jgi:hypothetical protein